MGKLAFGSNKLFKSATSKPVLKKRFWLVGFSSIFHYASSIHYIFYEKHTHEGHQDILNFEVF